MRRNICNPSKDVTQPQKESFINYYMIRQWRGKVKKEVSKFDLRIKSSRKKLRKFDFKSCKLDHGLFTKESDKPLIIFYVNDWMIFSSNIVATNKFNSQKCTR